MAEKCSPYSDQPCPYPPGFEGYGEVDWMAQNEGQKVQSTGLHFQTITPHLEAVDE